jgi:hypothetical protein
VLWDNKLETNPSVERQTFVEKTLLSRDGVFARKQWFDFGNIFAKKKKIKNFKLPIFTCIHWF